MNRAGHATESALMQALVLHPLDNVGTALCELEAHAEVLPQGAATLTPVVLRESISLCHKFALHDIAKGAVVFKYGESIGCATRAIYAGEHVHVHNLTSNRSR